MRSSHPGHGSVLRLHSLDRLTSGTHSGISERNVRTLAERACDEPLNRGIHRQNLVETLRRGQNRIAQRPAHALGELGSDILS